MNATMRTVELRSIRLPDLPGEGRCDYARDRLADEHVRELAELYREGGTGALPPIKLVEDSHAGELHLAGVNRLLNALEEDGSRLLEEVYRPLHGRILFVRNLGH